MFAALLTAVLWSISSLSGTRASRHIGGPTANRLRLSLALVALGIYAAVVHAQLAGPWFWWFVLSGAVGMGLGDTFIFAAYERLGTRLPVLITHCLAGPLAALCEWLWLGSGLTWAETGLCALILGGVAVALVPGLRVTSSGGTLRMGIVFAVASAMMVGFSAVIIRKSYAVAGPAAAGFDGLSAAFMRGLGGVALTWALLPAATLGARLTHHVTAQLSSQTQDQAPARPRSWRRGWPWLALTALCGPTLGMGAYQFALSTGKAGPVHAVLAILPILVMPLAWLMEGDRPTRWAVIGGGLAVTGAVWMALLHHGS